MLLSAESATKRWAGVLLHRSHAARLLAIFMTTLMVFAMAAGLNAPASQAQDDADIPRVAGVADPGAGAFTDPAETNTGDLADLPESNAEGVKDSPSADPSSVKPEGGVTYEENPEQWCINNIDWDNPEALADKCGHLFEEESASTLAQPMGITPMRAAASAYEPLPLMKNEVVIDPNPTDRIGSNWYQNNEQWGFRFTAPRNMYVKRFGFQFTTTQSGTTTVTHNGQIGEFAATAQITLNNVTANATFRVYGGTQLEVILDRAIPMSTGQWIDIFDPVRSGIRNTYSQDRYERWAKLSYATEMRSGQSLEVGTCNQLKGTSAAAYSSTNPTGPYFKFVFQETAVVKKLTLVMDSPQNVWPSEAIKIWAKEFRGDQLQSNIASPDNPLNWVRVGNNLEFELPPGTLVEAGNVIQVNLSGLNTNDLYYYETKGKVLACGEILPTTDTGKFFTDAAPNPELPKKCGQRIAMVFDLSNSIGPEGLKETKAAAQEVIEALKGTTTTLGIYTFATSAPAYKSPTFNDVDLSDIDKANELEEQIGRLQAPFEIKTGDGRVPSGGWLGGTNWAGALGQIPEGRYDIVYLVTDGEPTAVPGWDKEWANEVHDMAYYSGDLGHLTHKRDLEQAILAANDLKRAGTRVETIGVNLKQEVNGELKDSIIDVLYDEAIYRFDGTFSKYGNTVEKWSANGRLKNGYWVVDRKGSNLVKNPDGTLHKPETAWDGRHVFYPEARMTSINRTAMLAYVSGPTENNDWHQINDYAALATTLSERIAQDCSSKLIVKKFVEAVDGELTPGNNWEFTIKEEEGSLTFDSESNKNTDLDGEVSWYLHPRDSNAVIDPDKPLSLKLAIKETQQPGFVLKEQDGKRAKCFVGDKELDVTNGTSDTETFFVTVEAPGPVECHVINKSDSRVGFSLKKQGFVDGQLTDLSVDDVEFAIFNLDTEGKLGAEAAKQFELDAANNQYRVTGLRAGRYYIVETKSPAGFQLLPQPIQVQLSYRTDASGRLIPDGAGGFLSSIEVIEDGNSVPATANNDGTTAVITLANYKVGNLPKTGGPGLIGYLLSAMMLIGAAVGLRRKLA